MGKSENSEAAYSDWKDLTKKNFIKNIKKKTKKKNKKKKKKKMLMKLLHILKMMDIKED